ncbi:potassium-transporting ATPase subunit B, partial [mine drainage metagenome]
MAMLSAPLSSPAGPESQPHTVAKSRGLFDRQILGQALVGSLLKLDPRIQIRNPVMFVVLVGTAVTLLEAIFHPSVFSWSITIWLFLTVIFANFAEAVAGGARQRPRAETLRR